MTASIIFGVLFVAVFAGIQLLKPGKSLFDRS
jgi:hypothetical protein